MTRVAQKSVWPGLISKFLGWFWRSIDCSRQRWDHSHWSFFVDGEYLQSGLPRRLRQTFCSPFLDWWYHWLRKKQIFSDRTFYVILENKLHQTELVLIFRSGFIFEIKKECSYAVNIRLLNRKSSRIYPDIYYFCKICFQHLFSKDYKTY